MRGACPHAQSTGILHDIGSLGDGAGCIYHIVNDDDILTFYVAYDLHALHHIGAGAGLVAEHQRTAQILGIRVGTLRAAYVGRCDDHVFQFQALQIGQDDP